MALQLKVLLKYLMYYSISLILIPITMLPMMTLYVYKKIIFAFIYTKHRSSDITVPNSADAVWTVGENRHSAIDIIMLVNLKFGNVDDLVETIKDTVTENILNCSEYYPKLTSVKQRLMGYSYLLRTKINVNECVRKVAVEGEESLSEICSHYANSRLPLNDTFLWEMIILDSSSDWKMKENLNENQVPMLVRINHCVGDGLNLMNLFMRIFADNEININSVLKKFTDKVPKKTRNIFTKSLRSIHALMLSPGFALEQQLKNRDDVWDGPKIFHQRHLVYALEKYDDNIMESIKSIKQEMEVDTTFSEVLLTAISASIENHFKKNSPQIPLYVLMAVVLMESSLEINTSDGVPNPKNLMTFNYLKLPIAMDTGNVKNRLEEIQKETRKMKNSGGSTVNNFLFKNIVGFLPEQILRSAISTNRLTSILSNLPGMATVSLRGGNEIEDIFFFTPECNCLGMGFTAISYNDRLHLGLAFDEATIPSHEQGQEIVNDVLNNLLRIKDEILNRKLG